MNSPTLTRPLLSFPEVIRSREPRALFEERLLALLTARLKELGIVWNPKAFRGGLKNPALSPQFLKKLESLISVAEAVNWKLSKALKDELDTTVEDIETFNPPFRASLKRASADIRSGRFITQKELEKKYGIAG